jgi:hypothetical protein
MAQSAVHANESARAPQYQICVHLCTVHDLAKKHPEMAKGGADQAAECVQFMPSEWMPPGIRRSFPMNRLIPQGHPKRSFKPNYRRVPNRSFLAPVTRIVPRQEVPRAEAFIAPPLDPVEYIKFPWQLDTEAASEETDRFGFDPVNFTIRSEKPKFQVVLSPILTFTPNRTPLFAHFPSQGATP